MGIASNPANIRYNGTGRAYVAEVGGSQWLDLGEMEELNFSVSISTDKLKSTRNAARATILEAETEREASLSFGLREMTEENLKMALLGSAINTDNQSAGNIDAQSVTLAADLYVELGKFNVFITKISHGSVTGGPFQIGETVTGGTSSATGKVAWVGSGYLELINVSGTFQSGETITGGTSSASASVTGIETLEDVVVTDDATSPTTRYTNGTDYTLDADYGLIRKLSDGSISGSTAYVSCDYEAVDRKYIWGLSGSSVEKKFMFVSDKDDQGPRTRWIFHKVKINLNGDFPLIGEGASILAVEGSVLADTSQPSGQEYYKVEMM